MKDLEEIEGYVKPTYSFGGAEHVRLYEETDGETGHIWSGASTLILTTTGRCSGERRKVPLIYAQMGSSYLVVASDGGSPTHPQWYRNLVADPEVRVQVLDRRFDARARTATEEERPRFWELVNQVWPNYAVYAKRTTRQIPVVVLEPIEGVAT